MSFKSFRQFIDEDCGRDAKSLGGDGGAQNQYGRWGQEPVHLGVHRIEDPNVLQRLNAHIGLVNTKEYIDPLSALEHIQNALMRLGYQFEYNLNTLPNEQNVYPLRRFGGRQGFIDMDAEMKEDDGIIQTTGEALVLNVEFFQDDKSSRYEVTAQILPASLFDEEDIQPDPIRPNRAGVSSTQGDRDGINIGEQTRALPRRFSSTASVSQILQGKAAAKGLAFKQRNQRTQADNERRFARTKSRTNEVFPAKSRGPTRFKGDPKVKVDKVKGGFQVFVHSPRGFWIAQGQPWKTEALAKKDAKKFNEEVNEGLSPPIRRGFPFKDLSTAQKFIRNIDHSVEEIRIKNPKTKFPQVLARFKNEADAAKATKLAKKLGSTSPPLSFSKAFTEEISRTFAFATPDARDRAERLFGMSSSGKVTTSNKGKGKFKFTATGNFKQAQLDRIMKSVTQLKGVMAESQLRSDEDMNEDISRTFAFPTSDARDRAETLFGLAGSGKVTTTDKGKGKFKFTATSSFKGAQLDRIMKSVTQLKGVQAEDTAPDIAHNALRQAIQERNVGHIFTFRFKTPADANGFIKKIAGLSRVARVASKSGGLISVDGTFDNVGKADKASKIAKSFGGVSESRAIQEGKSGTVLFAKKSKKGGDLWDVTIKFGTDFSDTGVGFGTRDASIRNQGKALQGKFKKAGLKFFSTNMADGHAQVSLDAKNSGDAKKKVSKILGESRDVVKGHQMKIARDTLKMNDVFARVMGGMTKKQAAEFLMKNGNSKDKREAKLQLQREHLGEAKDENEKELERTRKDAKLASAFSEELFGEGIKQVEAEFRDVVRQLDKLKGVKSSGKKKLENRLLALDKKKALARLGLGEAVADLTVVAIKGNKVVGQLRFVGKKEMKDVVAFMKKEHPGAKVSVENKSGKIISVEQVTEQISNSSPAWGY